MRKVRGGRTGGGGGRKEEEEEGRMRGEWRKGRRERSKPFGLVARVFSVRRNQYRGCLLVGVASRER